MIMPDEWSRELADAEQLFKRGIGHGRNAALDAAIDDLRAAAERFIALGRPLRAADALTFLGAHLVNRAWIPPNVVNLQDAEEAEKQLSLALQLILSANEPTMAAREANALTWRARARTFLAESEIKKNELAINDAERAINLLTSGASSEANAHDLALAHLHLARAHFFRAASNKSVWPFSGKQQDVKQVRYHAAEALRLDPFDEHISVQGTWLLENAARA
jgi:tetratricopeptide (TPR) repeat protein